jgi:hypothetical protein
MRRVVRCFFKDIVFHAVFEPNVWGRWIPVYLPPPAQAQAQPAQAQAQAQERPPPLPRPPLRPLEVGLGGGLVAPVTLSVKVLTLPTTFCEKVCTPVTICAAKSAPGNAERPLPEG